MKVYNIGNFIRGWFIGDFEPSILKQPFFEVGILTHKKGEYWPTHYHKYTKEINVILEGKLKINDSTFCKNEIFVIEAGEISTPEFLEDCKILCIKTPSIPGDKIEVKGMFDYDTD